MDDTYSLDTIRIEIYPGAQHGTVGMQPARGYSYVRRERVTSTWKPSSSCMAAEACETARSGCFRSTVNLLGQEALEVVLLTYRCMGARGTGWTATQDIVGHGACTVHFLLMTYPSGFGGASSTVRDVVHFEISLPCSAVAARKPVLVSGVRPGESLRT